MRDFNQDFVKTPIPKYENGVDKSRVNQFTGEFVNQKRSASVAENK